MAHKCLLVTTISRAHCTLARLEAILRNPLFDDCDRMHHIEIVMFSHVDAEMAATGAFVADVLLTEDLIRAGCDVHFASGSAGSAGGAAAGPAAGDA